MVSQQEKYEIVEHILKSKTFSKATTSKVLLKFLTESTILNKEISAITIGFELFGKKYNPEKNDVNIRVNISHLRKRLTQYYENEGLNDAIIISIEPGQYKVSFTRKAKASKSKPQALILFSALATIIIVATLFYLNRSTDNVWHKLINNDKETTLHLGDVFGYDGPTAFGHLGWHRDFKINSSEEFYQHQNKDPEKYKNYKPGQFTFVNFENSYIIKPISQHFASYNYDFAIRPTSDFNIRSIKNGNTIYAGAFFNHNALIELFNEFSLNSKLKADKQTNSIGRLVYKANEKNNTFYLSSKSVDEEYALTCAFNGPNNTRHHMFFSNHGMGLIAMVEYFTNKDTLEAFSNKYLKESDEFIALYFVKGKDRTNMSMELQYIDTNKKAR